MVNMLFETRKDYTQTEPVRLLMKLIANSRGGEEGIISISYRPAKMQLNHKYELQDGTGPKITVFLRSNFKLDITISDICDN